MSISVDPYTPPKSLEGFQTSLLPEDRRTRAFLFLGLSFLTILVAIALSSVGGRAASFVGRAVTGLLFVATLLGAYGTLMGLASAVSVLRTGGLTLETVGGVCISLVASAANGMLSFFTFAMAMWSTSDFRRGRQLRRFGRVLLPRVDPGGRWSELRFESVPPEARVTADQWRENGRTEHASVAAFAALTTELMALGAPPELITSANRDARDEIRHTELCFSLARALDGKTEGPGPFPAARAQRGTLPLGRTFALARLAADSLIDGALHEGVSARVLSKLARRCEIPAVAAMLKEIARDEGRHAAHGWDVVLFCFHEAPGPVKRALEAALSAMPETMTSPLPKEAADGGWERLGIHGHALERAEYAAALADLRTRVTNLPSQLRGPAACEAPQACGGRGATGARARSVLPLGA
jgi:hypothetical protein